MTALAANKLLTKYTMPTTSVGSLTVKTGEHIFRGALVSIDTNGLAVEATTHTAEACVGVAAYEVDDSASAGGLTIDVECGVFAMVNSGATISADDIGLPCYVVDDQTVHLTDGGGTRDAAGIIVGVNADTTVRVLVSPEAYAAAHVYSLTATGLQTLLASHANGEGASMIGIEDAATRFVGTEVETALTEVPTFTELASVAATEGAALIGVEDADGHFVATTVETVAAELADRVGAPVATTAALQAVGAAIRADGQIRVKLDTDDLWVFDAASAAAGSAWVVVPTAGAGRWFRTQPSLADLVSVANGYGASLVGIEDAGHYTAQVTVEGALQELYAADAAQDLAICAKDYILFSLHDFREVDGNGDVGAIAANGGLLASDTTPIMRGDAAESSEISWAAGNSDIISTQTSLPPDLDGAKDVVVQLWVRTEGAGTEPASITVETSWDGGALVVDTATDATPGNAFHLIEATIAAADIPATPSNLTIHLTMAAHATQATDLAGMRILYNQ